MRVKPAIVTLLASLMVGGAIVMAVVLIDGRGKPNPPTPRGSSIESLRGRTGDGGQPEPGICVLTWE